MSNPNLIFHDELISSQSTHPLLINPPYKLTLSVAELTTPKELKEPREPRRRRGQKTDNEVDDNDLIPRPHNAFIIFRTDYAAKVRKDDSKRISIRIISRMASKKWKTVPEIVKVFFKLLADMYQQRHKILFPNYKYAPKSKPSLDDNKKNRPSKEEKKNGQIITWYLHDNVEDFEERNINFDGLNNFAQMSLENCPQNINLQVDSQQPTSAATFINYMAPPSTSYPSLPSLTTINPNPTYLPIIDDNNNSLISNSLNSSPPSDNLFFWSEPHNNDNTEPSFELPSVVDFNGF